MVSEGTFRRIAAGAAVVERFFKAFLAERCEMTIRRRCERASMRDAVAVG
jgi:hypothetical protein